MRLGGKENIHLTDTERGITISARQISVTKCGQMVCHGAVADVPRRHGRRATAPWQTCRGAVANHLMPCSHGFALCSNGFVPCCQGCAARENGMRPGAWAITETTPSMRLHTWGQEGYRCWQEGYSSHLKEAPSSGSSCQKSSFLSESWFPSPCTLEVLSNRECSATIMGEVSWGAKYFFFIIAND